MSTAEIASATSPGLPRLRTACCISAQRATGVVASFPCTTPASLPVTIWAAAGPAYVYPRPVRPPPCACTTTRVVESHCSVPSDSGASVGITYADASTCSISTSARRPATRCLLVHAFLSTRIAIRSVFRSCPRVPQSKPEPDRRTHHHGDCRLHPRPAAPVGDPPDLRLPL